MRVYIGNYNIAGQLDDWMYGFEKIGCKVTVGAFKGNVIIKSPWIELSNYYKYPIFKNKSKFIYKSTNWFLTQILRDPRKSTWSKILKEHDVFVYVWRGVFEDLRDFEMIKNAGKKLVVMLVGHDGRWYPALNQLFIKLGHLTLNVPKGDLSLDNLKKVLYYVRNVEKYADCIYTDPLTAGLFLRDYSAYVQPIIPHYFKELNKQRKKPVIVHVPSDPLYKGSEIITSVFTKLKNKGLNCEFIIPERKLSYLDAIKLYENSDIIVGQILLPGGGKQERELLAMGKVVLSFVERQLMEHIPSECPIIDVNYKNLESTLSDVIVNHDFREKQAQYGPDYIQEFHSATTLAQNILLNLENITAEYTYSSTFFRNEFIPETWLHQNIYNEYTKLVSNLSWYKSKIEKGVRAGLSF